MISPLLKRFQNWIGTWRGPTMRIDGTPALMEFRLSHHFDGEVIQLDARVINLETGSTENYGAGLWSLNARGHVINAMYGMKFGHTILHENPDDPDVLSLSGQLPGNIDFTVTIRVVDSEMEFNTRIVEGYAAQEAPSRVTANLHRVTGKAT